MPNAALVRWLAVVPDPVTGLDEPLMGSDGNRSWLFPDKRTADAVIRPLLPPRAQHLAAITSVVEFEQRKRQGRRPMRTEDPATSRLGPGINPQRRCWHCGEKTRTKDARYCDPHRQPTQRRGKAVPAPPEPLPAAPGRREPMTREQQLTQQPRT